MRAELLPGQAVVRYVEVMQEGQSRQGLRAGYAVTA